MNLSTLKKTTFGFLLTLSLCWSGLAQQSEAIITAQQDLEEADKRIDDYLKLLKLGYSETEIFQDLGNVSFLTENYKTAAFWYQKLIDLNGEQAVNPSYLERYEFARLKASGRAVASHMDNEAWAKKIKADYKVQKQQQSTFASARPYRELALPGSRGTSGDNLKELELLADTYIPSIATNNTEQPAYTPPIAVTADGQTAYFSRSVYVKPLTGLFSKKQLLHKIYKAEKRNGKWGNIREVEVCPKYASAVHPTISKDGRKLFFASDMKGSYGSFDIYVAELQSDGDFGVAMNLGDKVNTRKNDLYPNLTDGELLFYASDGRDEGYGGLDLYAVQVSQEQVSYAVNLGSPINSVQDDFSIALLDEEGLGYVMSNRGKHKDAVRQLVFSYHGNQEKSLVANREANLLEVLNNNLQSGYSNTLFDDQ